ncbi:MAG: ABC transporter ATP-binding protein [Candidatus Eisenbacteria bacterium]|nr:ABC transporter ATP-binding protein [Candidatus Eisenbacteria bacterium]
MSSSRDSHAREHHGPNPTTLRLRAVRFRYEDSAWSLSISDLQLGSERITCIVGPNGSGKSTLLRIAAGILPAGEGSVSLNGCSVDGMSRRTIARVVGYLPQESPAFFDYAVEAVVGMGRYAHTRGIGIMTDRDTRAVNHALAAVNMTAFRGRPLSHLSGGERRRALIASVLAQEPGILLLDEPTAALDPHHAVAVMRLLSDFEGDGPSVVAVTHDINLAALFSERMLLLVDGRIRVDGTPADVVRPDVMQEAYGEDVMVREHPETGGPIVVARRWPVAGTPRP